MDSRHEFLLVYCSIVSLQFHPKNPPEDRMSPADCVAEAWRYYVRYREIVEDLPCGAP